jgi:hypothetical protein
MASLHKESQIARERLRFEEQAQEHRHLARLRTHKMIVREKLAAVPADDPLRPSLQRKAREFEAKLQARERAFEDGR